MIEADFIAVTKEQVCSITGGGGSGEARSYGGAESTGFMPQAGQGQSF